MDTANGERTDATPATCEIRQPARDRSPERVDPRAVQRVHRELFVLLTDYHLAVAEGTSRMRLLAIFDATFACVRKHFRAVEVLLEQSSWPRFQQHCRIHGQIVDELAAYRTRLAGNAPLDPVECAHALDAVLIQFIREQPLLKRQARVAVVNGR